MFSTHHSVSAESKSESESPTLKVIYDGECPACSLVQYSNIENVEYISARDRKNETVKKIKALGYNLDEGMVVIEPNSNIHFGAEALKVLGMKKGGIWSFFSPLLKAAYPGLRGVRNALVLRTIAEQTAQEEAAESAEASSDSQ